LPCENSIHFKTKNDAFLTKDLKSLANGIFFILQEEEDDCDNEDEVSDDEDNVSTKLKSKPSQNTGWHKTSI